MNISGFFKGVAVATGVLAGSILSAQANEAETFSLPSFFNEVVADAENNCIRGRQTQNQTESTDLLLAISEMASKDSPLGEYIVRTAEKPAFMCLVDNPNHIGTSHVKFLVDSQGPYHMFYSTVSNNDNAYPVNLTPEEKLAFQAFGMLEEYAHNLNNIGLLMNSQMDLNNFTPSVSLKDAIAKLWADEALASTAAVIVARQQLENGNDLIWNAIQKLDVYKDIIAAVDEEATKDIRSLYNGVAHTRGFAAWYDTIELRGRAIAKVTHIYEQQLQSFKEHGWPVEIYDFQPQHIAQMAASLNAWEAFDAQQPLLAAVTSEYMFRGVDPSFAQVMERIEADVTTYKQQKNSPVPKFSQ